MAAWRKIASAILFAPIFVGLIAIVAIFTMWKLPMIFCERLRRIRYLRFIAIAYYGVLAPLVAIGVGLAWWEVCLLIGLFIFAGDWLLPDSLTYFISPCKRRAVVRAIEYVEQTDEVSYRMVNVIGQEPGRTIVSVSMKGSCMPAPRRFFAIGDDGTTVEEVEYAYVTEKHGVRPSF